MQQLNSLQVRAGHSNEGFQRERTLGEPASQRPVVYLDVDDRHHDRWQGWARQ